MSLMDRRYDDHGLPEFRVSRWTRIKTWRTHRKLHAQLKFQLLDHGDERQMLRCVHCGKGWQVFERAGTRWTVELPRR